MDKGLDLIEELNQIAKEKNIDREVIYEAIETSLISACKKHFGTSQNIKVNVDRETGEVKVLAQKEVVEHVTDEHLQIDFESAKQVSPHFELGDMVDVVITPKNFGRVSAQTAKQVVVQKFREAERKILFDEYITKEKEVVTGIVQQRERKNVYVALGRLDAVLPQNEQVPGEDYRFQDRIKVYVTEVKQTTKGPLVHVSRSHPELVKRLFEQEVPEVYDGIVEIKSIAREAGSRTKMAVYSKNPQVDAVGACVGQNGLRVNVVVTELRGEKIDIINWNEDPATYIAAALSPSKVVAVYSDEKDQSAKIIVPDNQLSLAIGRDGQNARLAAKLTGWRIDIKSESQAKDMPFPISEPKPAVEPEVQVPEALDDTEPLLDTLPEEPVPSVEEEAFVATAQPVEAPLAAETEVAVDAGAYAETYETGPAEGYDEETEEEGQVYYGEDGLLYYEGKQVYYGEDGLLYYVDEFEEDYEDEQQDDALLEP